MAVKYLDAKRLQGTNAERVALTTATTLQSNTTIVTNSSVKPAASATWTAELGIQVCANMDGESVSSVTIHGRRTGTISGNMWVKYYAGSTGSGVKSIERPCSEASTSSGAITFTWATPFTVSTDDALLFSFEQGGSDYFLLDLDGTAYCGGYTSKQVNGTWVFYNLYGLYMVVAGAAPTLNAESGLIFEEYDTGDHFIWSGSAWNEMR
jgi:hypothetical protein